MGLAPILVERIYETVREINEQGTMILLVEQNANFALEVSGRGYVLETGTVALADTAEALRRNPGVQRAYLGARRSSHSSARRRCGSRMRGCCRRSSRR